jgi:hypothetical protein
MPVEPFEVYYIFPFCLAEPLELFEEESLVAEAIYQNSGVIGEQGAFGFILGIW